MKFDLKNKFKMEGKNNGSNLDKNQDANSEKLKEETLKTEMIASILKSGISGDEDKTVTFADVGSVDAELDPKSKTQAKSTTNVEANLEDKLVEKIEAKVEEKLKSKLEQKLGASVQVQQKQTELIEEPQIKKSPKQISPESEKISRLINAIETCKEKMIVPSIDLMSGRITYPILAEIGEADDNLDFLEKLTSENFDILERKVHERFVACPEHPESFSVNVRLICPHCSSVDISKLNLIEHRRCGYISENKNFETSPDGKITKCPSCKKQIRDEKREIAMPAMWYTCNSCHDKFDDVSMKLYCRKFDHHFEVSDSHSILIPGFTLKNLQDTSNASISPILKPLKELLDSNGFSAEENHTVIGKSGNHYRVNIFGEDEHKRTVFIYIKNPNAESDNSELNSKIIEVLDTSPTVTILIGFPSISEKAKAITSNYNVSIITEKDPNQILSSIKEVLSTKVSKIESD